MKYWIAPALIVVCVIAIPFIIYNNNQRVQHFKERCIKAGGVPDTYRQMICYSKESVLFIK